MEKPTPEQIQRADALAQKMMDSEYWQSPLADTIAKLDAMQAERDKACADLGEIDRIAEAGVWNHPSAARNSQRVAAIAAPYRVETDPLADLAQEIANSLGLTGASSLHTIRADDFRKALHKELAKRGLEIGRSA